jgi:hypothetical protein
VIWDYESQVLYKRPKKIVEIYQEGYMDVDVEVNLIKDERSLQVE